MEEPPPPSYDDAITGNFPDAPPPKPSSNPEISVSTSFLGPERYKVPETIVPFPSSPEPAASSLPPSPGHDRENRRVTTPRISPTSTANNRLSPSATVVTTNTEDNSGSSNQSQCIKLIVFIICVLAGIGILYFALSGGQDEESDYDYNSYDQPKVYRTTTTTTPRPSGPDDCKTKPPQIVEKRGFGSFQNCKKNYKGEYYNKTTCAFKCTYGHILSSSPGVLDPGYNSNSPQTRIVFTCVRAQWVASGDKNDQKIKCLTTFEHVKENVG